MSTTEDTSLWVGSQEVTRACSKTAMDPPSPVYWQSDVLKPLYSKLSVQ